MPKPPTRVLPSVAGAGSFEARADDGHRQFKCCPEMPPVSLDHISIAFGHLPLLDDASLQIEVGERVGLIGRNGTGKSTLLQIINGNQVSDSGSVRRQPGLRIGQLLQDATLSANRPVFDVVSEGLGDLGDLVAAYHHAAVEVAERGTDVSLAKLGRLQHELEERDGWRLEQRVELVLARLDLPSDVIVDSLSGGWRRRVLLARALVGQPDLLLLDEPTNHLDIDAMNWLETFLREYPGAVLFVTHDRVFLQRLATRIVELDRGHLTSWPGDYATFLRKKEEWLANEAVQNEKFDKRLAEEEAWLRQGIKARRTRNEGRVRALLAMREQRAARRARPGTVRLQTEASDRSGQLVFEADRISKSFGVDPVVRDLSLRVMRGDRVGLIGPNGSGKTTLLRLLIDELQPDTGEVRRGTNVQIAYYDQQREQLDPERTVFDTVGDGNDTVTVNGRPRHVHALLARFSLPDRAGLLPRQGPLGRRTKSLVAGEIVHQAGERPRPRRADERSRHRDARAARRAPDRVARHRCCWSATTGRSLTTSSRARSYSRAMGVCRNTWGATTIGCGSDLCNVSMRCRPETTCRPRRDRTSLTYLPPRARRNPRTASNVSSSSCRSASRNSRQNSSG